jgi:predicted transcriptional regulator
MKMQVINVRVSNALVDNLKILAATRHETLAEVMRRILEHDTVERKKKAALENESELRFPPLWCADQHATVNSAT